jgi:hypothetical protein
MDINNSQLRIFELRRAIVKLQQEYQVAKENDLKFSIKKTIRLKIKDVEHELALLESKDLSKNIGNKENHDWTNNKN